MEYRIAFSIGGLSLKNVNFGIIGCGAIAEKHGQALLQLDNANLVAASDVDISKAERFAEKYFTKDVYKRQQPENIRKTDPEPHVQNQMDIYRYAAVTWTHICLISFLIPWRSRGWARTTGTRAAYRPGRFAP